MGLTRPTLVAVALCAGCATGLRPPPSLVETDLDGDTRVDRIETIEKGRVARVVDAPPPGSKPQRTVVIAIDAVPYVVFARLQRQGLFREFFPAARMIAPLPSLTNVGYAAILKTAPVLASRTATTTRSRMRSGAGSSTGSGSATREWPPFTRSSIGSPRPCGG